MKTQEFFRQGLGFAMRLGVEFVVATGVGSLMGYFLDTWLETEPWFLALGVIFGGAAGALNVYRMAQQLVPPDEDDEDNADPNRKPGGSGTDDLKF